jgi:peptidoglycan/xylan/chitin deacetylase (PgdA/CDA1 family)
MNNFKGKIKKIFIRIFCILFRWTEEKPTILIYHSVSKEKYHFNINPEIFEEQIKYLKKENFEFLKLKDLENINKLFNKSVLITFDDGYENVFINAVPILEKYNVPAIFFIPVGLIDNKIGELKVMNWEQIKALSENPLFEIGSHAYDHVRLTGLNEDNLDKQIGKSKAVLERQIDISIRAISFPFGRCNQNIIKRIKDEGYDYAFGVEVRNLSKKEDFFSIPRIAVDNSIFSDIFFKDIFKIGYSLYWKLKSFLLKKI